MSSTCTEQQVVVETKKGKYTIPVDDDVDTRCEAQARCTKINAILAPFTEKSEFDQVISAINSCEHMNPYETKWVGLSIAPDNSTRVFDNGVKFDYKVHGHLYQENHIDMPTDSPNAILDPMITDKLQISNNPWRKEYKRPYVCFEQKQSAKSDAITGDASNLRFIIAGGSIVIVVGACLVGYLVKQVKNLKSKLRQTSNDA